MKPESVIELVVGIALVVIVGFLVVAMMEGFLEDTGIVGNFLNDIVTNVTTKAEQLIESVSPTPGG